MTEEEKKDLSRYFVLAMYRDEGSILLDEYEELNDILKRNSMAQELDDALYKYYMKKITYEEYRMVHDKYVSLLYGEEVNKLSLKKD